MTYTSGSEAKKYPFPKIPVAGWKSSRKDRVITSYPRVKVCTHKVRWKTRSAECGVWKMRSVENAGCGKCGVWKMSREFQFSISI